MISVGLILIKRLLDFTAGVFQFCALLALIVSKEQWCLDWKALLIAKHAWGWKEKWHSFHIVMFDEVAEDLVYVCIIHGKAISIINLCDKTCAWKSRVFSRKRSYRSRWLDLTGGRCCCVMDDGKSANYILSRYAWLATASGRPLTIYNKTKIPTAWWQSKTNHETATIYLSLL